MKKQHIFTIELQCTAPDWWRFNTDMACVAFDEHDEQRGFYPISQRLAEVGANLLEPTPSLRPLPTLKVESGPCAYAVVQLHIIPHSLPREEDVWQMQSTEAQLIIHLDGKPHTTKQLRINPFGGLSLIEELRPKAQ